MSDNPVSIVGKRQSGFSGPVAAAVTTAVCVGVQAMEQGDGLTIGSALGTTLGAAGAYAVTKVTDCSIGEAFIVGGLAGRVGVLAGAKIDEYASPPEASSSLFEMTNKLLGYSTTDPF